MVVAMDRTVTTRGRQRRLAWLAASLLAVTPAGCSYMKGFRSSDAPKVGGFSDPSGDPYLAHHKVGPPPRMPGTETAVARADSAAPRGDSATEPAAFVRSTAHPTTSSGSPEEGAVPTEVVSLGTPVALPTEKRPRPQTPPVTDAEVAELRGPATDPAPSKMEEARAVVTRARAAVEAMTTYQVQLSRQERVGDVLQPAEDVQLSIRRAPRAVRLEWTAGSHKGREAIYSASEPGALLHVHMGDSPIPVPTLSIAPDSAMVMKNSRHPITEAGFDAIVKTLETGLSAPAAGSTLTYVGLETPAAVGRACHKIERHNAAGETWLVFLDAETALPALVEGTAANGDILERYRFHQVKANLPELASAEAFDPARRWPSAVTGGLLGRLARTTVGDAKSADTAAPR